MDLFFKLWLAIPAAAAAVWFWSFLSWAVLPIHQRDWNPLPDEDAVMNALRPLNLPVAPYIFPYSRGMSQDPAFKAKWQAGPVGLLNVWNPSASMPGNMIATFIVYLAACTLIGYLCSQVLPAGESASRVFQVAATAGVLAFTFAELPTMIWFQSSHRAKLTAVIDGIVMGLLAGFVFAALWPAATTAGSLPA